MTSRRITNWILAADLLWIIAAFAGAALLRYGLRGAIGVSAPVHSLLPFLALSMALWGFLFYRFHLEGFYGGWRFSAVVSRLFLAVLCLMGGLLAPAYLARVYVSRLTLAYFGILLLIGFAVLRFALAQHLRAKRSAGDISRLVVVGSGTVAQELALKIRSHPEMLCEIVGFLFPDDGPIDAQSLVDITVADSPRRISTLGIVDLLRALSVDEVMFALSRSTSAEIQTLAARCREAGIRVSLVPQPYELYLSKPNLLDLDGLPLVQLSDAAPPKPFLFCKRMIDLVAGSVLSLLALPIVLPIAAILRAKKGQAFCWDLRCGQNGYLFAMLRLNVPLHTEDGSGFEKLLYESSVAELPQLWNVLRGQMSLVGPRPESPTRTKRYTEWHQRRLSVKPGITGLAQVHGLRDHNSSEDKTRYDLQYLLNPSLLVDISLLLQTIGTLAVRLGRFSHGAPRHASETDVRPPIAAKEEVRTLAHRSQSGSN
jgi:lipopolysaccharide/colanic/teichoic acid biosynthesis glycosyltransferase